MDFYAIQLHQLLEKQTQNVTNDVAGLATWKTAKRSPGYHLSTTFVLIFTANAAIYPHRILSFLIALGKYIGLLIHRQVIVKGVGSREPS
ncbi:hypothetical protein [Nostoc sp. DSM 114161]|uniref:hypothetical protein n=1 Tax=Nostoc sp. DSM 114161 TaxID=3440143 RepID=UPI004045E235